MDKEECPYCNYEYHIAYEVCPRCLDSGEWAIDYEDLIINCKEGMKT